MARAGAARGWRVAGTWHLRRVDGDAELARLRRSELAEAEGEEQVARGVRVLLEIRLDAHGRAHAALGMSDERDGAVRLLLEDEHADVDERRYRALAARAVRLLVHRDVDLRARVHLDRDGLASVEDRRQPASLACLELVLRETADGHLREEAYEVGPSHPEDAVILLLEPELLIKRSTHESRRRLSGACSITHLLELVRPPRRALAPIAAPAGVAVRVAQLDQLLAVGEARQREDAVGVRHLR